MGSQLGKVLDVGLYDFPENARIIKVKILFNINTPIRAGMYIGNDKDGINWVKFRFENVPMFCFRCGLVGHMVENCRNSPSMAEGATNPRGAWLRSRNYGRMYTERNEKTFNSNPVRSLSGGQFSPIPKGLLDYMAHLNINKSGAKGSPHSSPQSEGPKHTKHYYTHQGSTTAMVFHQGLTTRQTMFQQKVTNQEESHQLKRKLEATAILENITTNSHSQDIDMAGLANKASQHQ